MTDDDDTQEYAHAAQSAPVKEPVAYLYEFWADKGHFGLSFKPERYASNTPLYSYAQWVGLTDEDIEQGWKESWVDKQAFESAVWWAEKKLKEKNT
jgi:hypothetical protein